MPKAVLKSKIGSLNRESRIKRTRFERRMNLLNKKLSSSIDVNKLFAGVEPLIVDDDGMVMNFDPNNPQHRKWLDD